VQIAGEVKDFDIGDQLPVAKEARRMDTFIHYGMAAGIQAIRDAGLEVNPANAERIGVNIGSGIGGLAADRGDARRIHRGGRTQDFAVLSFPGTIINMISGNLSIMYG
jgi:3-oxoacyl-[acyl-carrier-protein] synthase II